MIGNRMATRKIVTIGIALFAAQFTWVIFNTYVPIFLQTGDPSFDALRNSADQTRLMNGFGLSAVQTGFIMSLDNIAAFLLQPLTGVLSDRVRSRYGRRLPYLLLGMPAAALGIALIPLLLPGAETDRAVVFYPFLACLLVMVAAMAFWRAPVFALMADLTPSANRSHANGILNLMAGLGGVLAFGIGSLLYALYRPFPFWMAALLLVAGCVLIAWRVKEPVSAGEERERNAPSIGSGLSEWLRSLGADRRRSMGLLVVAVFCAMMGFHPIDAFFSSYGVSVLKLSEANSGLVLSAAYIAFILAAIPVGVAAGKIGRKRVVLAGLVLFAAALLTAFFTPLVSVMVVLMALGGIGWAMIDINIFAMVLDTAGKAERSDISANMGTATGVYFIATTLAATLGPVLNGWLIDLSGRNYSTIFLIGPAFFILAFACVSQVRHGEAY